MITNEIPGTHMVIDRLGRWPAFHDAEVLELKLTREVPAAEMLIHVWNMTDRIDEQERYILEHHTLVRFLFNKLELCELSEFNHQNVLFSLTISRENLRNKSLFRVDLDSSFGLSGSIVCGQVVVLDVAPSDAAGRILLI